jgi:hypothetical protein
MEVGSNNSTAALRLVEGGENEIRLLGCNSATLSQENKNTELGSSRFGLEARLKDLFVKKNTVVNFREVQIR